jgi:hypothetical protein
VSLLDRDSDSRLLKKVQMRGAGEIDPSVLLRTS